MKQTGFHTGRRRALSDDRAGGIEGLPLQLMILILIATLATAVMIGWMGNIQAPDSIGDVQVDSGHLAVTRTGSSCTTSEDISIYVTDQNGDPLKDAVVCLSGLGITTESGGTVYTETGDDGMAHFPKGLKLRMNNNVGFITVDVSKAGSGEDSSCRITAIVD